MPMHMRSLRAWLSRQLACPLCKEPIASERALYAIGRAATATMETAGALVDADASAGGAATVHPALDTVRTCVGP
jgi:hypothetical protein